MAILQQTLKRKVLTGYNGPQINYIHGGNVQRIELHRGCPWQHEYCYEPYICVDFRIPELTQNLVQIIDMNLLAREDPLILIKELGAKRVNNKIIRYEAVCGFDYRFLTQDIVSALKEAHFIKPRLAWDGPFSEQYKLKDALRLLWKAGYKPRETSLFIIVNWKIPYEECVHKLDLMKVWNVKVCDCCYDGGYKHATPTLWTGRELKDFRAKCRLHNHLINFYIDPLWKGVSS